MTRAPSKNARLIAIFVGGRSSRMGGLPKGRLVPEGETACVLERAVRLACDVGGDVALVGDARAYADIAREVERLDDAAGLSGPIAGLVSALDAARGRDLITLACDMPKLTPALVARLANEAPEARVLAASVGTPPKFHPFFARWRSRDVAPEIRRRALGGEDSPTRILSAFDPVTLTLSSSEAALLEDWDTPGDAEGAKSI